MKEFLVGRADGNTFTVKKQYSAVSHKHCRITVNDDGSINIEDLHSTNGTFVKDSEGTYRRIENCSVSGNDIIRLGGTGIGAYCFRVAEITNPANVWRQAWHKVYNDETEYRQKINRQKQKIERHDKIKKMTIVIGIALFLVVLVLTSLAAIPNILRVFGSALGLSLPRVLTQIMFGRDNKDMKQLEKEYKQATQCPNPRCMRTTSLSPVEINNLTCNACKCHA